MQKLYYTRHGLSVMNEAGLMAGSTETPLSPKGREQSHAAGVQARELDLDCIVSSPQSRALETAQIIAEEIDYPQDKILVNDLLVERHLGELEGQQWILGRDLSHIKGIEPSKDLLDRAQKTLDWLYSLDVDNVLVVSHGSFGRALRSLLTDIPFDDHTARTKNAEIQRWL